MPSLLLMLLLGTAGHLLPWDSAPITPRSPHCRRNPQVEAVLYLHPAVHEAAVFGVPNRVLGELVAAAVTLRTGMPPPAPHELVRWCQTQLAHYKVPSVIHIVDKMPKTGELCRCWPPPAQHRQ